MSLVRCPKCRLMTSDRGRWCYHCGAEVQPYRTASLLAITCFALLIITTVAGLVLGVPWVAGLVGKLQEVDDVYRVWRVGVALAIYLLIFIVARFLIGLGRGETSVYVPPQVSALAGGKDNSAGQ